MDNKKIINITEEVEEARGANLNLKERLDNFDSHLDTIETQQINDILNIKNPQIETAKQPILVFVDDDTRVETYTFWHRLAQEKGIKISLGVVPEWIENGSSTTTVPPGKAVMTKAQLKEMYDYGHDLLSHGYDTRSIKDFLSDAVALKHQLYDSKQWLIDNGFTRNNAYDYFVYPQGLSGTTQENLQTKAEVRKYYRYGINAFTSDKNVSGVFDSFDIPRVTGDNQSATTLKTELDKIIVNKGMMIVLTHAWHSQDHDGGDYNTWADRYKQLIDYARLNNVSILPFSEAIKIKGNVFSIGEYTDNNKFFLNNDGSNTLQNVFHRTTYQTSYTMNDDILSYNPYSDTIVTVQTAQDTLLGVGGVMQVRRSGKYMSYALYFPYNSNKIYKRRYDEQNGNNVWLDWELITKEELTNYIHLSSVKNITTTGSFVLVPFDKLTSVADMEGCFDIVSNTFTVPSSGNYAIDCQIGSSGNVSGDTDITLAIFKNGNEQNWLDRKFVPSGRPFLMKGVSVLKLNKNDTIQIKIRSSVAINLDSNGIASGLSIRKK